MGTIEKLTLELLDEMVGVRPHEVSERLLALASTVYSDAPWECALLGGIACAAEDADALANGARVVTVRFDPARLTSFRINAADPPSGPVRMALIRAVHTVLEPVRGGAAEE